MNERFLPIGIQDFEDLRTRGCIYVDKTDLIYKLATEGKPYFLSQKNMSLLIFMLYMVNILGYLI